jgi:hypothetical protein
VIEDLRMREIRSGSVSVRESGSDWVNVREIWSGSVSGRESRSD